MVSPRTKNTPEDWKRTRFCAHTHTKKSKGTRTHCCYVVSSARVARSISPGPSSLFGWLAVVSLDRYERDRHRDRFFSDRNFFDARCTAIFPSALRSIQNALEAKKTPNKLSTRARENTQKSHTQRRRRRRQRRKERNAHAFSFSLSLSLSFERAPRLFKRPAASKENREEGERQMTPSFERERPNNEKGAICLSKHFSNPK